MWMNSFFEVISWIVQTVSLLVLMEKVIFLVMEVTSCVFERKICFWTKMLWINQYLFNFWPLSLKPGFRYKIMTWTFVIFCTIKKKKTIFINKTLRPPGVCLTSYPTEGRCHLPFHWFPRGAFNVLFCQNKIKTEQQLQRFAYSNQTFGMSETCSRLPAYLVLFALHGEIFFNEHAVCQNKKRTVTLPVGLNGGSLGRLTVSAGFRFTAQDGGSLRTGVSNIYGMKGASVWNSLLN